MMILLCELAMKSEGIRFRLLWTTVFSTGAMGRIPITLIQLPIRTEMCPAIDRTFKMDESVPLGPNPNEK